MRLLLDAHAFLWFILDHPKLSSRDPFDRLLVAQAICEQIPPVSVDTTLDAYAVIRLW